MKISIKVTVKGVVIYTLDERKVLGTFVHFPPSVSLASAPVYTMSLTYREWLFAVGNVLKSKLVRLLSLGEDRHFEPQRNRRTCHLMMLCMTRRIAAGQVAAVRDKAAKEAKELCESGQCASALPLLQKSIDFWDLPSRALKAWLMLQGREGVAKDCDGAFELVEEGARLGCHHCQGVMAECYRCGYGCVDRDEERSLELARESSGKGSRYGQYVLGWLYRYGGGGVAWDYAQALALYRLAAAQNLDGAQYSLGDMYYFGRGVAEDLAEALWWYQLAAAQGNPIALYGVAECYERGRGVGPNKAEAIYWYRRAQAAGDRGAAIALQRLRA